MKVSDDNSYIVRFKSGQIWHFYFGNDNKIYYKNLSEKSQPIELAYDTEKDFSLCIDEYDMIHIIFHSKSGEINYIKYNGKTWGKQLLSAYDPDRYLIRFPTIIVINECIHIIFAIGNTFNIGFWSLYHYFWNGKKWTKKEITKFTAGRRLSPFHVDVLGTDLHLVYRALVNDKFQIKYTYFQYQNCNWSIPQNVTSSNTDCNMPSILIKGNSLNVVWTYIKDGNLVVKYKYKKVDKYNKNRWGDETILSDTSSNCMYPQLMWIEQKLWSIWYQNEQLYYATQSDEHRNKWVKSEALNWDYCRECQIIKYSTNYAKDNISFKVNRIFANLYYNYSFPLIDGYIETSILIEDDFSQQNEDAIPNEPCINEYEQDNDLTDSNSDNNSDSNSYSNSGNDLSHNVANNYMYIEKRLGFWLEQIQNNQQKSKQLVKEIQELEKCFTENQQQFYLLMYEYEVLKREVEKLDNRNIFKRIFSSFSGKNRHK